jgi:phenylpropionate dioxygenase-like ring-hydroxylating dioxygenase large terminal subunit
MQFQDFWYIVSLSKHLKANQVLARTVLGEWLAIFRGSNGEPVALQDRCLHRNSRLSEGKVNRGILQCPYHGWLYDGNGHVIAVPAQGPSFKSPPGCRGKCYAVRERDG